MSSGRRLLAHRPIPEMIADMILRRSDLVTLASYSQVNRATRAASFEAALQTKMRSFQNFCNNVRVRAAGEKSALPSSDDTRAAETFLSRLTYPKKTISEWASEREFIGSPSAERHIDCLQRVKSARTVSLDLTNLNVEMLYPSIGHFNWLRCIDLSHNHLKELPPSFGDLTKLTKLNLKGNALLTWPPSLCRLGNLLDLDISENRLTCIPNAIGHLSSLRSFNAYANDIDKVSDQIGSLCELRTLVLSVNPIGTLPVNWSCSNLERLNLSGCQLLELPGQLFASKHLSTVDLSENKLRVLPPELLRSDSVAVLEIYGNQFKDRALDFSQMTNLIRVI